MNIFVFFGIATLMFDGSSVVLSPVSKAFENSAVLFNIFIYKDPSVNVGLKLFKEFCLEFRLTVCDQH